MAGEQQLNVRSLVQKVFDTLLGGRETSWRPNLIKMGAWKMEICVEYFLYCTRLRTNYHIGGNKTSGTATSLLGSYSRRCLSCQAGERRLMVRWRV